MNFPLSCDEAFRFWWKEYGDRMVSYLHQNPPSAISIEEIIVHQAWQEAWRLSKKED